MPHRKVKGITAQEAWAVLEQNPRAVLIDVRSTMEYLFVGHPRGAIHIPWIDEPDWRINPSFSLLVRKVMLGGVSGHGNGCAPVILICRSGNRSREAGELLAGEGLPDVFHVSDGFEGPLDEQHHRSTQAGWRHVGLPWEQC
ncbi:MAG: rhodanese-like domain-containing protein [Gammaproteobacteria bacterium]|nr:rhodanese-like domain-containing protein [Gammaproteobacteria bacterium]